MSWPNNEACCQNGTKKTTPNQVCVNTAFARGSKIVFSSLAQLELVGLKSFRL